MIYIVSKEQMKKYLNLEIEDNDLFPETAPLGTSFYELEPESGIPYTVTTVHIINLLEKFINGEINDNRVKEYVESLIALNLFEFDESDDALHDAIVQTVYTLDELKDVNGKITPDEAEDLLNMVEAITEKTKDQVSKIA